MMRFVKELYPKVVLIKAAYNFTDIAYIHLDCDDTYYYVNIEAKEGETPITEKEFVNEMLTQSVRHEVFLQTKSIRELLMARAMATSVVYPEEKEELCFDREYKVEEILKDWFDENE